MKNFRNLQVWQKAHALGLEVYRVTQYSPDHERFGMTTQLLRAAASIGANLAEGRGRTSDAELCRISAIAIGSASELEYHFLLVRDLNYLAMNLYTPMNEAVVEVKRMLAAFVKKLTAER
jgi:four helix bundle protein